MVIATLALPAATGSVAAAWCAPAGPLSVDALPPTVDPSACDLTGRTVVAGSIRLTVPGPGEGISAVDNSGGGEATLTVRTDLHGVVSISRRSHGAPPTDAAAGAAALPAPSRAAAKIAACRDGAFATAGYKFTGRYDWYLNSAGTPANLRTSAAPTILQATADVTRGNNKCGLARPVRLSQRFVTTTSRRPQISAAATCASGGDGVSVTGWMRLPKVLAYTCSYYKWNGKAWVVSESDMALSTAFNWFTGAVPRGCRYAFDLRGVVMHERGHTFGLGHVDHKRHSSQAMSTYSPPCSTANRSFGYGDYRGLATMYGIS